MNPSAPQFDPPLAQEQKRGSERVLLRIPIRVEGTNAQAKPFQENTFTLVINRNGALIALKNVLRPNDEVKITNLQNQMTCPFRVIRRASVPMSEGPEWGVECLEPNLNFWGISFPKAATAPVEEELIDALLECSACRFRELAQLTMEHYRSLVAHSSLNRRCPRCAVTTGWHFGFAEADQEEVLAVQKVGGEDAAAEFNKERAKRMAVKLPLRIRAEDGTEEIAKTENLSKTGVCFISGRNMKVGDVIKLTVGYAPGTNETEIAARVVWRRPLEGQTRAVYGVHLEEGDAPDAFPTA